MEKYNVTIAGVSMNIMSDDDEAYVNATVEELNKRITDIQMKATGCTKMEAIIMCALSSLDEKQKLEKRLGRGEHGGY